MQYLTCRIYSDETNYKELSFDNPDFTVSLGIAKQKLGLTNYAYQMSIYVDEAKNFNNAFLMNKFIFEISTMIHSDNDIYKIEIIQTYPNFSKTYVFNQGDFHDILFMNTNDWLGSNVAINFIIDSMEQNYR